MLAVIGAAIAPGVALLSYFYLRDNLEPEPINMVIRAFIFGVLLVFPIMTLQHVIVAEWELTHVLVQSILSSATIEEFFKWLIVYQAIYKHVEFDEPYDGILYSVAVSLGFATLENFLYLLINGLDIAFWRALLPVSSHALFAIFMGYYFGLAKFSEDPALTRPRLLLSLFLPIVLHAIYNLILLSVNFWILLITPFMIVLWWHGLKKVQLAHDFASKTKRTGSN